MIFLKKYIFILLIFISVSFTQGDKKAQVEIISPLDFFTIDNLGNIYTVKNDELVKFLPNGKFFARYSNLKLGKIASIDATNPLKIILYYRDFQTIVFLDNQLSANSEAVLLDALGLEQSELACAGSNNSFWIYNKQNNELIRFNENLKKVTATGNLKQILKTDLTPNYMIEHNGFLFLNCPNNGIFVFDMFGSYSKLIAIKELKEFSVNEKAIYYKKDSVFCSYNLKDFEEICKPLINNKFILGIKYINKKIYFGYKDSLVIKTF